MERKIDYRLVWLIIAISCLILLIFLYWNRRLVQEITHRKSVEASLRASEISLTQAKHSADAANQAKSVFLANMSHEIRTPMNAVLGFAQLLQREVSLSPEGLNKVATIIKSGDHLLAIINDILEVSRIEAGRVEMHREPVNLPSLLDDLALMFRMRAEEKGLQFIHESATGLPRYVMADQGKLRQVMINLLGNAVKFTKVGFVKLRAHSVDRDRVAIEVHDSGIGISPEEQKKLFRPFERTHSGEQTAGGTGLGLAISREYALLMGGDIKVISATGEGSCFRFEFEPALTSELPASVKQALRVTGLTPGQGVIRILVVDDISTNRELLRGMLEPLGFTVDEADSGEAGLARAKAQPPQIVLMDLVMPGMDGTEATKALRSIFPKEKLSIIGLTASAFTKLTSTLSSPNPSRRANFSKPWPSTLVYNLKPRPAPRSPHPKHRFPHP